jgi:hypothetical protein
MFHSDLVYLRANVKALKEILKIERKGLEYEKKSRKERKA